MQQNPNDAKQITSLLKAVELQKQAIEEKDKTIAHLKTEMEKMAKILESYKKAK